MSFGWKKSLRNPLFSSPVIFTECIHLYKLETTTKEKKQFKPLTSLHSPLSRDQEYMKAKLQTEEHQGHTNRITPGCKCCFSCCQIHNITALLSAPPMKMQSGSALSDRTPGLQSNKRAINTPQEQTLMDLWQRLSGNLMELWYGEKLADGMHAWCSP